MATDPAGPALRKVVRSQAKVRKVEGVLEQARKGFYSDLDAAHKAGVSTVKLSRELGTSESRIRQTLTRQRRK